jgi:hypothetical protein
MKDLHAQAGSVGELITALREFDNPTVVSGPHESNFKAQEDKEYGEEKWQ